MITCLASDKSIATLSNHGFIFLLPENFTFSSELTAFAKKHVPQLKTLFKKRDFTGKKGQLISVPLAELENGHSAIFVGLGAKQGKAILVETYRRAIGSAIRAATSHKCETVAIQSPTASLFGISMHDLAKETALVANLTAYKFTEFLKKQENECDVFELTMCVDTKHKKDATAGLKEGAIIAQGVNKARHWIDLPPSVLTPPALAQKGQEICKKTGLKCTVFSEKDIIKMGMGGLAGVSSGSHIDCQLLIMEYTPKKKNAPTIALVGKGITFDSGGLSLKPAVHMETMKEDMSGAAAVIATMEVLAQLKPNVRVIGVAPLSENLPGNKATKPGDILRFYNGKTAEVKNTDAEGRLILADALSYAVEQYKPDAMIDIATLTGACAYALGPFYTGLMSQHDDLAQKVQKAAQRSGDHVWALPFDDDYKKAITSDVADICNIGKKNYMAGAVTAGFFLQNFVGDTPWVHLDIAGTAFNVPDRPYYRSGATGVGVRLFVDLIMNW